MNKRWRIGIYISVFFGSFILSNGLFFNEQIHQPGEVTDSTAFSAIIITSVFVFINEKKLGKKKRTLKTNTKNQSKVNAEPNNQSLSSLPLKRLDNTIEDSYQEEKINKEFQKFIVLWWVNNRQFSSNKVSYPKYFRNKYFIEKGHTIHNGLLDNGYLRESTQEEKISFLAIDKLKKILGESNLSKTGNKKELVNRVLNEDVDLKFLDEIISHTVTPKGKKMLDEYMFILELEKHEYSNFISPAMFLKERNKKKYPASFKDVVWACYQELVIISYREKAWFYLEKIAFSSYLFLKEEKHVEAITFLLEAIIIALSGSYSHTLVYEFSEKIVPQRYINELVQYDLSLPEHNMNSYEHLLNRFDEAFIRTSAIPFSYFDKLSLEDIITDYQEKGATNFMFYQRNEVDRKKFNVIGKRYFEV